MPSISVCVVTKNEAKNIVACLNSVVWADEIIIIDSCSTDDTVELCKQFTDKIIVTPWKGCGPQKQQAFELATSDWVLILDADERVTSELATEIKQAVQTDTFTGYSIPFKSHYCGKQIKYGDWRNERHVRLLKRTHSRVIPRLVHFGIKTDGPLGGLRGHIMHYSFPDINSVISKMHRYSTDGAMYLYSQGKHSSILSAFGHALFTFLRGYVFKFGFLDGRQGLMLAISNAEGAYYKYAKLVELHLNPPAQITAATESIAAPDA